MQWLAAEIADNCEDEGLRAAALHTAELADGAAPPPAVLRPRLSLSSLPSLVSRVSELAAENWRRPSDTATPRRRAAVANALAGAHRAVADGAPDESPGAYVRRPPRRGRRRAARAIARRIERSSRAIPAAAAGARRVWRKAQFCRLYAPLASAAAASRSNALELATAAPSATTRASLPAGGAAAIGAARGQRSAVHGASPPPGQRRGPRRARRGGGRGHGSRSSPPAF